VSSSRRRIRSIEVATVEGCASVAFPAISCGVYHYPVELAAPIALSALRDALLASETVRLVRLCLFSDEHQLAFEMALEELSLADPRVKIAGRS
jgi:O-acetyl-ADP-ribose deacetylase